LYNSGTMEKRMKKTPIKAKNELNSSLFVSFLTQSGVFCNFFTRSTGCAKISRMNKYKANGIKRLKLLCLYFVILFVLTACDYAYKPNDLDQIVIEISPIDVKQQSVQNSDIANLNFKPFKNGSLVNFKNSHNIFKIHLKPQTHEPQTLLILPHYFDDVYYFNDNFKLIDRITKNAYKENRSYSSNLLAFDVSKESFYIVIFNKSKRKVLFSVENSLKVKSYDQKLSFTFVAVYTAILTLFVINVIFFYFLRKINYLYYALYLFFSLFALLFQEGFIAYFPTLSQPVLGIYTQAFWLKLPTVFFLLFIFNFLELKKHSKFDYKLMQTLFVVDILMLVLAVFLHLSGLNSISNYYSLVINLYSLIGIVILFYISIKYTSLKVPMAKYLLFGWLAYYGTLVIRVFYALDVEPLAFWMPRAFEFGLLINALALSFGLADQTLNLIKEKDLDRQKIALKERALFCNELVKSFQVRTNKTIGKYYGNQKLLDRIINKSFVSSIMQLIDVKDVFYIYEYNTKLGFQKISRNKIGFNITHYVEDNKVLLNTVCDRNKAVLNVTNLRDFGELPFIIIPISDHKYDNLCLFLTIPTYEIINPEIIDDLNQFANDMTIALIEARKFKQTTDAARFDGLTHLLNRKSITEKLNEIINLAQINANTVTFAFIDIDDFKNINDVHGHDVGDDCLVFLSEQMRKQFNENCYTGRFGGDEFIVLINNLPQKEVENKFKKLFKFLNNNKIKGIELRISIGIATATPENNLFDVKKLMKAADVSLYESKQKGKNQLTFSKWSNQAKIL